MFYSFKNLPIKINNNEIFAQSAELSYQNSLEPLYLSSQRHAFNYYPTDGIQGNLRLSYYLTGNDYLKTFILNETGVLSGNIGGLHFNSGYLGNYSINAQPNRSVVVNSDIQFFEDLKGSINPVHPPSNTGYNVLNFSDITVSELAGYSNETVGNILSCDFNYSAEIVPTYTVSTGQINTNFTPYRVLWGQKRIDTEIICDNINPDLPITGKNLGVRINFNHPHISSLTESFTCSGVLSQRSMRSSTNDLLTTSLVIRQNNVDENPIISGFDPLSSSPGGYINISGKHLSNIVGLEFFDKEAIKYSVVNDNLISGIVPYDALTGKIFVKTYGGSAQSTNNFNLSFPSITINSVTPYTGLSGQSVLISGNNFYRISHVFFGNKSGDFRTINSGVIQAYIPSYAESGFVRVVSTGRLTSANSLHGYVPSPFITGFGPNSGFYGNSIEISGFGFNGISSVRFNGINATSFTVNSNTKITATLPTGNVRGYVYLQGRSGVNTNSQSKFNPSVIISGINPLSGLAGDLIDVSGRNFQSGLMYTSGNGFRVKFGSAYQNLDFRSETLLTGTIPKGATFGPIVIFQNDGVSSYPSTTNYIPKYGTPTITTFNPQVAYSGFSYYGYIQGTNLFNITGIMFSGYKSYNTGRIFTVNNSHLKSDILGLRVNIVNYTGFTHKGPGNDPGGNPIDGVGLTGRFQLKIMSNQYPFTSLSTSTADINVKTEGQP